MKNMTTIFLAMTLRLDRTFGRGERQRNLLARTIETELQRRATCAMRKEGML